jgi:hypothetical protein
VTAAAAAAPDDEHTRRHQEGTVADDGNEQGGGQAVRTQPVRVKVYVRNGAVVSGLAHLKPGADQARVSDILNRGEIRYIAITDADYAVPGDDAITTDCVLLNVDDIVMVDVAPPQPGDEDRSEPLLPGAPV